MKIDDHIVHLIAQRIEIVRDIGNIKRQLDLQIRNEKVEEIKFKRLIDLAKELQISPGLIQAIYLHLIKNAIQVQEDDKKFGDPRLDWTFDPNEVFSKEKGLNTGLEPR